MEFKTTVVQFNIKPKTKDVIRKLLFHRKVEQCDKMAAIFMTINPRWMMFDAVLSK